MKRSRAKLPKNNVRAVLHGEPCGHLPKFRLGDDSGLLECSQQIDLSQQVDVRVIHDNHHADRYTVCTNRNESVQTNGRLSYKIELRGSTLQRTGGLVVDCFQSLKQYDNQC